MATVLEQVRYVRSYVRATDPQNLYLQCPAALKEAAEQKRAVRLVDAHLSKRGIDLILAELVEAVAVSLSTELMSFSELCPAAISMAFAEHETRGALRKLCEKALLDFLINH